VIDSSIIILITLFIAFNLILFCILIRSVPSSS